MPGRYWSKEQYRPLIYIIYEKDIMPWQPLLVKWVRYKK